MPTLRVHDAEFYYQLEGEGHPLICISGYTCDHTQWLSLYPSLTKKFRTLIFDNRGCGRTKDGGEKLSADLMANDVINLAKALQLKDPHIIGQSMGGTIAQSLAARYGGQIGKVALLTTTAKWRQAMLYAFESDILLRERGCSDEELLSLNLALVFGEAFLSNSHNIQKLRKDLLENPYPQSLTNQKRQFDVLKSFDGRHLLPKISSPTLIVYGKEDLLALPHEAEHLFTQIKDSQLIDLEGGHGLIEEQTQNLTRALVEFFV